MATKTKLALSALLLWMLWIVPAQAQQAPAAPTLPPAPPISPAEFESAKRIYFDRCAGCHGVLRKGATGPMLLPEKTRALTTPVLKAFITNGTGGGMPDWGRQGILSEGEIDLMARYIQQDPPVPPELPMAEMKKSWNLIVPPDKRPTKPEHNRDWQNFFSVTLRDAGQVAIIDGDTKEIVNIVKTGFAVHISRMSASGRYVYTIGRDGRATMIDLWMKVPDKVAEVKPCSDARSIDTSKYKGKLGDFTDKLAVIGCYWPPQFIVLDGATLEPLKVVSTRSMTYDTMEYHQEPRVASIVASHFKPEWVINIKETGLIWLVDYSDLKNLRMTQIQGEKFLHDGGWDSTKRYFMVAANMANKVVVIDVEKGKLEAIFESGIKPHPGRGANWIDPKFGPVNGTPHLGEGKVAVYGTDPAKHKEYAWKKVREIKTLGGGGLFIKTNPKSKWVWVDHALNGDPEIQKSVCVFEKEHPEKDTKCWKVSDKGRAVHFEYNKAGDEVWVSVWGRKDGKSEIVVYDDKTLKVKNRIDDPRIITPTGKFNVYNTVHDIY
ncbi:MAG: c-type cytochrome [candidate division NC10 bacterium]|nr:c-type cytochrome [candidate division NC10 bacterium]